MVTSTFLLSHLATNHLVQHPLRAALSPPQKTLANPRCPRAHSQRCLASRHLLPSLRHSTILARPRSLPHIRPVLQRWTIWHSLPPLQFSSLSSNLVAFRFLLPCPSPSFRHPSAHAQIHLWLSPARHHLAWRLCGICDGSPRILPAFPRNHKYPPDPRL